MFFNPNKNIANRTSQEQILILLSTAAAIGLIPFIVLRALSGEWMNALYDSALFSVFLLNGLYIYKSHKVRIPRLIFALLLVFAMLIGFYIKGIDQIPWSYPALVAIFFAVRPKLAATFCSICIAWLAVLAFPMMKTFEFTIFLVTLSFTCLFVYVFANLTREQRMALEKLSRRDPLTKLRNRRAFDYKMVEFIGSIRNGLKTCLIMFDIDHFKNINDEFGHSVGDRVLYELGSLVSSRMRKTDHVYRIGGEEFAIILTNSSSEDAKIVAEDIRIQIGQSKLIKDAMITISLGIAEYRENESKDSWYKRCDEALYLAKDSGRNTSKHANT